MKAALLRIPRPLGLAGYRIIGGGGRTEEDVGEYGRERLPGDAVVVSISQSCGPPWQASRGRARKKEALIELLQKENSYSVCLWA